ncbi:hypothetical protein PG984_001394 [Apiospora sp. TS-2023a]
MAAWRSSNGRNPSREGPGLPTSTTPRRTERSCLGSSARPTAADLLPLEAKDRKVHVVFDQAIAAKGGGKMGVIDCTHIFSCAARDVMGVGVFVVDLHLVLGTAGCMLLDA